MNDHTDLMLEIEYLYRLVDDLRARVAELQASEIANAALQKSLFSKTEMRILIMLAQGYSDSQIAERLHIVRPTVQGHTNNIYRKIGARNRVEAARYAWQRGIVRPDEAWETVKTMQWRDAPQDAVGA